MPYDSHTKSSSGENCKAEVTTADNSIARRGPASEEEAQGIYNRLSAAHTKSSSGQACKAEQHAAQDTISPKASEQSAKQIFERLSSEHTKSWLAEECKAKPEDVAASRQVPEGEVEQIVERLHTTHTKSSSAAPCKSAATRASDSISRKNASDEEIAQIFKRLNTTHTKSSGGGVECKEGEPLKPAGYGLKMYPAIEGLECRFSGRSRAGRDVGGIVQRLTGTQTKASQARQDNPRILLYPERTLLCNNVQRIGMFQQSGATVAQKELARREKWFV